jgi:hypothetical protein
MPSHSSALTHLPSAAQHDCTYSIFEGINSSMPRPSSRRLLQQNPRVPRHGHKPEAHMRTGSPPGPSWPTGIAIGPPATCFSLTHDRGLSVSSSRRRDFKVRHPPKQTRQVRPAALTGKIREPPARPPIESLVTAQYDSMKSQTLLPSPAWTAEPETGVNTLGGEAIVYAPLHENL